MQISAVHVHVYARPREHSHKRVVLLRRVYETLLRVVPQPLSDEFKRAALKRLVGTTGLYQRAKEPIDFFRRVGRLTYGCNQSDGGGEAINHLRGGFCVFHLPSLKGSAPMVAMVAPGRALPLRQRRSG